MNQAQHSAVYRQRGFFLIELMVAMAVMGIASVWVMQDLVRDHEESQAKKLGRYVAQHTNATRAYLADNAPSIATFTAPVTQLDTKWLKSSSCLPSGTGTASKAYLPCNFPAVLPLGATLKAILRAGTAGRAEIETSMSPVVIDGIIREDLSGVAMNAAQNTALTGSNSAISTSYSQGSTNSTAGKIFAVASNAPSTDIWLRVDGSNKMAADLNMDTHNLIRAKNITALATISTGSGNIETLGGSMLIGQSTIDFDARGNRRTALRAGSLSIYGNRYDPNSGNVLIQGGSIRLTQGLFDYRGGYRSFYRSGNITTQAGAIITYNGYIHVSPGRSVRRTYFTDNSYGQHYVAKEGSISTSSGNISTSRGSISTSSGNIITYYGDIGTYNGDIGTIRGNISTSRGHIYTRFGSLSTGWGHIYTSRGHIYTRIGSIATSRGNISTRIGSISTSRGSIFTHSGSLSTYRGNIYTRIGSIFTSIGNISTGWGSISTGRGSISTAAGDITTGAGNIWTTVGNLGTDRGNISSGAGNITTGAGNIWTTVGNLGTDIGNISSGGGNITTAGDIVASNGNIFARNPDGSFKGAISQAIEVSSGGLVNKPICRTGTPTIKLAIKAVFAAGSTAPALNGFFATASTFSATQWKVFIYTQHLTSVTRFAAGRLLAITSCVQ